MHKTLSHKNIPPGKEKHPPDGCWQLVNGNTARRLSLADTLLSQRIRCALQPIAQRGSYLSSCHFFLRLRFRFRCQSRLLLCLRFRCHSRLLFRCHLRFLFRCHFRLLLRLRFRLRFRCHSRLLLCLPFRFRTAFALAFAFAMVANNDDASLTK